MLEIIDILFQIDINIILENLPTLFIIPVFRTR